MNYSERGRIADTPINEVQLTGVYAIEKAWNAIQVGDYRKAEDQFAYITDKRVVEALKAKISEQTAENYTGDAATGIDESGNPI